MGKTESDDQPECELHQAALCTEYPASDLHRLEAVTAATNLQIGLFFASIKLR